MFLYNLRFGWWNVALSPAAPQAKTKANTITYETLCCHIETMMIEQSCDFLALCEVSPEDVINLKVKLNLEGISFLDLTCKAGKTRFDIAIIYNHKKIKVDHKQNLSKFMAGNTIKAAQLVEVENLDDSKVFYVYVCHWASRRNGDSESRRTSAADIVYHSASELMESGEDVIVMGDFNDNPFDLSLNKHLKANRCHDAVKKYPKEYFYNPFWRTLVSELKYSHATTNTEYRSGSYRYKEFLGTIWHSFDQVLVSGSFLCDDGDWQLNEPRTKVLTPDGILTSFNDKNSFIDHLPIVCEITRT